MYVCISYNPLLLHETDEVECNNNNIIRVTGYNWLLSRIR